MGDKILHLIAGAVIFVLAYILSGNYYISLISVTVAGLSKEVWDYFGHGTSELKDFTATMLGGGVGLVLIAIYEYYGRW